MLICSRFPTASTWSKQANPYQILAHGRAVLNPDRLLGYLTAPWVTIARKNRFYLLNDAEQLYLAREQVYPQTLA